MFTLLVDLYYRIFAHISRWLYTCFAYPHLSYGVYQRAGCLKKPLHIQLSFIHLSTPIRRLTTMSFHLFLSSAAKFSPHKYPNLSIHIYPAYFYWTTHFLSSTLPSSICKRDKPLETLSTCPAYSIFFFIMSFTKCNYVCNCVCTRFMTSLEDALLVIPSIILY